MNKEKAKKHHRNWMEWRVLLAIVSSWTALGVSANKGGSLLNPVSNTCKWKMPLKSYIENWKTEKSTCNYVLF